MKSGKLLYAHNIHGIHVINAHIQIHVVVYR
jgi:hypothetical protein